MKVMLGLVDEVIKKKDVVDWSCNKIGGLPDWMVATNDEYIHPRCEQCSDDMYLVCQLYCPLQNSEYHRTLYVFGCVQTKCLSKQKSFTVIRCQKKDDIKNPVTKDTLANDDWGCNDWLDETIEEKIDDIPRNNNENESEGDEDVMTSVIHKMNDVLNLSQQNNHNNGNKLQPPSFNSYYINATTEEEYTASSVDTGCASHEMLLYQQYMDREGQTELSSNLKTTSQRASGGGDAYEKTNVKHGDHAFHRFLKTIKRCPQQIMRYEWHGSPLLYSNASNITPCLDNIPNCENCGAQRHFEMQLMPQLAHHLHVHKSKLSTSSNASQQRELNQEISIDFGCLYIYTCSNSCWKENDDVVRVEFAALQLDPESSKLCHVDLL